MVKQNNTGLGRARKGERGGARLGLSRGAPGRLPCGSWCWDQGLGKPFGWRVRLYALADPVAAPLFGARRALASITSGVEPNRKREERKEEIMEYGQCYDRRVDVRPVPSAPRRCPVVLGSHHTRPQNYFAVTSVQLLQMLPK